MTILWASVGESSRRMPSRRRDATEFAAEELRWCRGGGAIGGEDVVRVKGCVRQFWAGISGGRVSEYGYNRLDAAAGAEEETKDVPLSAVIGRGPGTGWWRLIRSIFSGSNKV